MVFFGLQLTIILDFCSDSIACILAWTAWGCQIDHGRTYSLYRRWGLLWVLFIELILYALGIWAVCNAQSRHFSHGSEIPEVIVQRYEFPLAVSSLMLFNPGRATDDHPPYFTYYYVLYYYDHMFRGYYGWHHMFIWSGQGGTGIGKKDPGSIFFLRLPSAGLTNYVIRHMS